MDKQWSEAWSPDDEQRPPLMVIRHDPDDEADPPGEHDRPHTERISDMLAIDYPADETDTDG